MDVTLHTKSNEDSLRSIRGDFLVPHLNEPVMSLAQDHLLSFCPLGIISDFRKAVRDDAIETTLPGCIWTPGLVDTHVHFPQLDICGSASGPLLPWLEETVFPEEAKFRCPTHATVSAAKFVDALHKVGTTTASVYGASDEVSTDILFSAFARRGLRGIIGLTLMDQNCPPANAVSADEAIPLARDLIARWHGFGEGRLQFAVTPRFALSCTPKLMREAGKLAQDVRCLVQTHMSENLAEVGAVSKMFPGESRYLEVYEAHGLAGPRTLFAHCIWLEKHDWERMGHLGCAVSHCPDSNFFLGSGQMDLDSALGHGLAVGLGSDVGAGRTFDMRRAMSSAFDTARVRGTLISPATLVWLASRGGALALGLGDNLGCLAPGYVADLVAWRFPRAANDDAKRLCERLAFCHDTGGIERVYVAGRSLALTSA